MTIEIPKKEPLNIVPFIDIMLVLLAMVLSVSTFIAKGEIPIALPESRSAQAPLKNSNEVLIQVTGEGTLHWNGEERPRTRRSTNGSAASPATCGLFFASTAPRASSTSSVFST